LTGAKDYAVDLIGRENRIVIVSGIGDNPLEGGLASELFNGRAGKRMAEERFGKEKDKG
jgi:hypothetical protein